MRRPIGVAGESRVDENGDMVVSVTLGPVRPSAEKLAEPAPTKFKVGDRVRVSTWNPGALGVVDEVTGYLAAYRVKFEDGRTYHFSQDQLQLITPSAPPPFKVGDRVRVRQTSKYYHGYAGTFTVDRFYGGREYNVGVHGDRGFYCFRASDLEPVTEESQAFLDSMVRDYDSDIAAITNQMADMPLSWRASSLGRSDYTFALKIDHGASDTFTHPVDAEVTIQRSTPWEPFHGRSAKVVRVDADGTHHVKVEGFDRETYRFDADELKAVAPKEVVKPRNQQPREPSLISWATEDGCNSIASSLRRDRVRELARELFASNPSVLSFIERVGDFSVRSIHSRSVHIISDARFQNAIRTAWNRNEGGLRTACVKQAMRIVDERGGK